MKLTHCIYIFAVGCLALGNCQIVNCQNVNRMTLEQCREQALQHNKTLSTAKLQIKKQEAELKAMKTKFLPNFNLLAADLYNGLDS